MTKKRKYVLAPGTQVRKERFGLLFYSMDGPRLYFLSSRRLLDPDFFDGKVSVEEVIQEDAVTRKLSKESLARFTEILDVLKNKGVIVEC